MKVPFVDLGAQYTTIKTEIDKAVFEVINKTAFVGGEYPEKFEKEFASILGVKHCIGCANGTDAIYITLKAMGIGPGDEVITVANSFIATSEAISATGAKVVFVDCLHNTYNIDPEDIIRKISSKTKAIIPVHLYGQPAEMEKVMQIARDNNLLVLEDCAQSHLARYKEQFSGTFGNAATFSFYPGKNLGAYGDAGAIITNDDELADKIRRLSNHGRSAKYDHIIEGFNSRLDGIQAAVLSVKLKHLSSWSEARRTAAAKYSELLSGIKEVITPFVHPYAEPVYHLYVIRVPKREELISFLKENGIAAGIHYPIALPNLSAYSYLNHKRSDFPNASAFQDQYLSLPMFPEIKDDQINYVVEKIREFFSR